MPPSWARKAGVAEAVSALQQQLEHDDTPLQGVRLWRRKLRFFPGDKGPRPPAYGSFSRTWWALHYVQMEGAHPVSWRGKDQLLLCLGNRGPRPPPYRSFSPGTEGSVLTHKAWLRG